MGIRSTAKAIILKDGKILLHRCFNSYHGEYFSLPGGGQNAYETLYEAVVREGDRLYRNAHRLHCAF